MGIRIQPRDLEVPEDAPFLHDRLDRKTPARVLTQIVASVEGPCVLSIDGPFGAGKSTFLRLWTQHLKNKGFPVARLMSTSTPSTKGGTVPCPPNEPSPPHYQNSAHSTGGHLRAPR